MLKLIILVGILIGITGELARCQLPDDIQRELNQSLEEQARIQALREQHQRQIKNRQSSAAPPTQSTPNGKQPPHDPNNYSYQQVSPPIQYSYYQPYGDAAAQPAGPQQRSSGAAQPAPVKFDLNDLNFDLPAQPQAQTAIQRSSSPVQQHHLTPSFTGAGGLPILRPISSQQQAEVPIGNAPLPPQARVQQGPPLTEADFKDITGGENYGASGDSDFGLGAPGSNSRSDNTDAQLQEFGMPTSQQTNSRASSPSMPESGGMNIPDFGAFGALGGAGNERRRNTPSDNFGNFGADGLSSGGAPNAGNTDFDFASQPSSARGDQAAGVMDGGAPGSLQSLLGAGFPGLGGSGQNNAGGLDDFARGGNNPQTHPRVDDGALNIADMGDKSDGFSGANLGNFEQPTPQNDQDFNYAASNQQPASVPYPDGNPQPVGTLWALTQPQSLTQTRYNALLDKGTYQDYPAYQEESNEIAPAVSEVVDATPKPRAPKPGRYGIPSPNALAPEHRSNLRHYDYSRSPSSSVQESGYHYE